MKKILLLCLFLAACGEEDHRTDSERGLAQMKADVERCRLAEMQPEFDTTFGQPYVKRCLPTSK